MKKLSQLLLTAGLVLTTGLSFAKGMSIDSPYVREVPPGQMTSASFLTLKNDRDKEVALIKAVSDVAKNVELHEHVHNNGMMEMRQVAKISVPANGETVLKPGGYHIMLIGLTRKIKDGDMIDISLEFDDGSKQDIKAEVKKIMAGMKKMKGMKKDGMKMQHKGMKKNGMKMDKQSKANAMKKHTNPMPNLMMVYKKMGDQLNLNEKQLTEIKSGIAKRSPVVDELMANIMQIEADINDAALSDKAIDVIDQLANNLMHERLALVKAKTECRETAKQTLDENQFKKMVSLYRTNFMKQPQMNKMQANMAMKKHTNPMPNLMMVVKKMSDQLNLSAVQAASLKKWQDERGPVMNRQYNDVMKMEADLQEAALNNEPAMKLAGLSDGVMQVRMKIIRGKVLCRDNMRRILDNQQYEKVKELYKTNFM